MTLLARSLGQLAAGIVIGHAMLWSSLGISSEPLEIRVEPLTVPPATQPLVSVVVRNRMDRPCQGRLAISNRYPFTIVADIGTQQIRWEQTVFVASAPYARVTVDGRPDEWKDAIPVSFEQGGKSTTISTFWSRRRFYALVAVQEQQQVPYAGADGPACDAVQLAISPLEPSDAAAGTAGRFEFLLASAEGAARCFQLAAWDTPREFADRSRALEPLIYDEAEVAIHRDGDVTYYECSLPFNLLREAIEPAEGREFFLSVLVHDPDGTGLRDLGQAAGLWAQTDDAPAWSRWRGMARRDAPPSSNPVRWGLCTSKY
jgi:hypothetical protein